jgi:multidrug efflux system outer membrane protein
VTALEASVRLAERRYANGYSPFLELLDARRSLFDAQLAQSDAVRERLVATAVLFKALGGGWEGEVPH